MGLLSQLFGTNEAVIENGALVNAMQRAATQPSPQSVQAVHQALLDSDLIIPTIRTVGDGTHRGWQRAQSSLTLPMITARSDEGRVSMLVFTDEVALRAWCAQGCAWTALHGPDVFAMALETRVDQVVINPAGPTGGALDRRQIASLAEGLAAQDLGGDGFMKTALGDQPLALRLPQQEIDDRLLDRIREALGDRQEIAAGYLFEMAIGRGEPHLGVGVEFGCLMSPQAVHETMSGIMSEMKGHLPDGQYFDFLPLTRDEMLNLAREHGLQIYRRL